jgi:hypothetical protein
MSHYRLTSTVILHLANQTDALGEMDLSGNMTRQIETDLPVESDASHIANVGRLVEDMELKMRNLLRMFLKCFYHSWFYGFVFWRHAMLIGIHRRGIFWQGKGRRWRPPK